MTDRQARYEVYNKDPHMLLDRQQHRVWHVHPAPPAREGVDDPDNVAFVRELVALLNAKEQA